MYKLKNEQCILHIITSIDVIQFFVIPQVHVIPTVCNLAMKQLHIS
jgi:hypothetical protein